MQQFIFVSVILAATAQSAIAIAANEVVQAKLREAKSSYAASEQSLTEGLVGAIDKAISAAAATGDLAAVQILKAERHDFDKTRKLPVSPRLRIAVSEYTTGMRLADRALDGAYEAAKKELTKQMLFGEAEIIETEHKELLLNRTRTGIQSVDLTPTYGSRIDDKDQLQAALTGSVWDWGDSQIVFDSNGYVRHRLWDAQGNRTRWEAIDRRTAVLIIETGRKVDRYAILKIAEDLNSFAGYGFENAQRLTTKRRLK